MYVFFFSSRRRHTRYWRDWSSDVCSSDLKLKGKMREKVEAAVEDIKMSKFLATIRTDVPLTVTLDDLKITEPDKDKLAEIFAELEFKSLTNKILNKPEQKQKNANLELDFFAENADDGPIVSKNANFSTLKTTPHDYQLIDTEAQMREICDFFLTNEILSLDTETTSTNAIEAELVGLSFSVEEGKAFYVPISANREEDRKSVV